MSRNPSFRIIVMAGMVGVVWAFNTMSGWVPYKDEEAGYALQFPGEPTESYYSDSSTVDASKMKFVYYDASNNAADSNLYYMGVYKKLPAGIRGTSHPDRLKGYFNAAVEGAANNVNGVLVTQKKIGYLGHPGRDFKILLPGGAQTISMRFILVKDRSYLLQVIAKTEYQNNQHIRRFMGSLVLLDQLDP